jgi:hypothetical protein
MPLICSYYSNGIPGVVAAAPTYYYMDIAYSEQEIREQWNIELQRDPESITFPWSYWRAHMWHVTPWWASL